MAAEPTPSQGAPLPPVSRTTLAPASPPPPPIVEAIDRLGEIVAVVAGAYLCSTGKVSGMEWMGFSALVLGVQTSIRGVSARTRAAVPVSGIVGLLFVAASLATTSGHA